jgi:S-adenosylmethionine decarboxylase proenzyme
MFQEYESSGKHMICDFKEIENLYLLNSADELVKLLKQICKVNDFTVLKEIYYEFTPIGCSIIFLLSESHLSIHTFPEKKHMSFDIYTCRQYENNDAYNNIYNILIDKLKASSESTQRIIDRYF